jgi:hypothetical protein
MPVAVADTLRRPEPLVWGHGNRVFEVFLELRWSPVVGQFGGGVKLGPGCRQAANLSSRPCPYASSGVRPARVEWGRRTL